MQVCVTVPGQGNTLGARVGVGDIWGTRELSLHTQSPGSDQVMSIIYFHQDTPTTSFSLCLLLLQ
jgi:hypothetical protein